MRIFSFPRIKPDIRCVIALISTALLAIICGIVLCKTTQINPYMQNYVSEYVYFVYNFRNASLILPHLFHELVYGYAFFVIAYCTRFRLFAIPLLFLKCMITGVYTVLIVSVSAFGGTLAAVFVFIPVSLVSIFFNNYCNKIILDKTVTLNDDFALNGGKKSAYSVMPEADCYLFCKKGADCDVTFEVTDNKVKAPVAKGQIVGRIDVYREGVLYKSVNVVSAEDVKKASYADRLKAVADGWSL